MSIKAPRWAITHRFQFRASVLQPSMYHVWPMLWPLLWRVVNECNSQIMTQHTGRPLSSKRSVWVWRWSSIVNFLIELLHDKYAAPMPGYDFKMTHGRESGKIREWWAWHPSEAWSWAMKFSIQLMCDNKAVLVHRYTSWGAIASGLPLRVVVQLNQIV